MPTLLNGAVIVVGLGALGVAPIAGAAAIPDSTSRLQREALADDGAFRLLESLTTTVGARFAGTPGDLAAIAWSARQMQALGFENVRTEPVEVPRWIRGEARGEIVSPFPQSVVLLALGGSAGTPAGGVEAAVVAVADLAGLERLGDDDVRGKIVFFTQRMSRTSSGSDYGDTVPIRGRGPAAAAQRGAVAVLIRSVGTDSNRLPHTGGTRFEDGQARIPAAALSIPDAELLERQLARGGEVRFRLELGCRFEAVASSANVLGEIVGSEAGGEIVLLVAHRDSWDVGTGAQDNGTGVALVLEAARLAGRASGGAPRRTIRVLLTANEEYGLSGARAYAALHAGEIARHMLAVEMDSGAGRVLRVATRLAPGDSAAADELAARLEPLGVPRSAEEAGGGADLSPLAPMGLPIIDLDQDRSLYFDIHHTENDTLDKVDPANLRQLTAALATVIDWAAGRAQSLERVPVAPVTPAPNKR